MQVVATRDAVLGGRPCIRCMQIGMFRTTCTFERPKDRHIDLSPQHAQRALHSTGITCQLCMQVVEICLRILLGEARHVERPIWEAL